MDLRIIESDDRRSHQSSEKWWSESDFLGELECHYEWEAELHVIEQWERGDPPNYNTIYRLTSKKFNDDDEMANFKKIYLGKKRSKFSSWLKRVLKKKWMDFAEKHNLSENTK